MMDDNLQQIANEWRMAGLNADIPATLFSAITNGARGWEKRVVKNIAYHSPLFNTDGSVRNWDEIVTQWEYRKSVFGDREVCAACGKNPIVENCILHNQETGDEIIVGNKCVIRYLDIIVDGVQLTEEEKREFLTGEMTEARKEHFRSEFMRRNPTVWTDLNEYEALLQSEDPGLLKSMIRRMQSHGFPGKVLEHKWLEFLSGAARRNRERIAQAKQLQHKEAKIKERLKKRAAERAQLLQEMRESRGEIATDIRKRMAEPDFFCTPKEQEHLDGLTSRLELGGLPSAADNRIWSRILARMDRIANPAPDEDSLIRWLRDLDPEPLTDAERTFRLITIGEGNEGLGAGAKSTIKRLKIRYG